MREPRVGAGSLTATATRSAAGLSLSELLEPTGPHVTSEPRVRGLTRPQFHDARRLGAIRCHFRFPSAQPPCWLLRLDPRGSTLGELQPGPYVHVDHHSRDLGNERLRKVLAQLKVPMPEVDVIVRRQRLRVVECRLLLRAEQTALPPARQMGDDLRGTPTSSATLV